MASNKSPTKYIIQILMFFSFHLRILVKHYDDTTTTIEINGRGVMNIVI